MDTVALVLLCAATILCAVEVVVVAFNPRGARDKLLESLYRGKPLLSLIFGVIPGSVAPEAVLYLSTIICAIGLPTCVVGIVIIT